MAEQTTPASNPNRELAEQGRQLYREGDLEEALTVLRQAHERFKEAGDQGGTAETANDIGVLYTVLRRYKEAESWLHDAQRLFVNLQDIDGEAQTLGNLGSMYQSQGDHQQAAAYLQQAADRFHLVGDDERRSATLRVLSMVRLRQFRFLQALAAFDAALACHPRPTAFHRLLRRLFAIPQRLIQR